MVMRRLFAEEGPGVGRVGSETGAGRGFGVGEERFELGSSPLFKE